MPAFAQTFTVFEQTLAPAIRLWMLRVLSPLGEVRALIERCGREEQILCALGVDPQPLGAMTAQSRTNAVKAMLYDQWIAAEQASDRDALDPVLAGNLQRLGDLVGLDAAEQRILGFVVCLRQNSLLEAVTDLFGPVDVHQAQIRTAAVLQLPLPVVQAALSSKGRLAQCGLLRLDRDGARDLTNIFTLLSREFTAGLLLPEVDLLGLLRNRIAPAEPPELTLADYAHLEPQVSRLRAYLQHVLAERRAGVNLLLYGPPGTGKTALTKVLAAAIGAELFEVNTVDADDDPIGGMDRLNAYSAAQQFLQQRRALMLFDEVDDVFDAGQAPLARLFGARPSQGQHKGAIIKTLENNAIPTFWLSNEIKGIDAAFVRRFDWVLELPIPPRGVRERLLDQHTEGLIDARAHQILADCEHLAPALLTRAASVARVLADDLGIDAAQDTFVSLIDNTLRAQGHPSLRLGDVDAAPGTYDLACLNADTDLDALIAGLRAHRSARLLLHGAPGTGKTAFARHLAARLDQPLLIQRASDLLSKWVGESEQNMAAAFRRARATRSMLLIDEIDSFLQERGKARNGWEITLVNELLTQIESFDGLLLATTNFLENLDVAALRRFDLKIHFRPLSAEQAWALLRRHCIAAGVPEPDVSLQHEVDLLAGRVAPGDFAAVARRARFAPLQDAQAWLAALRQECALRPGVGQPVGFVRLIERKAS
ncbi:MAG: AAA family ATPase [Thiomonas sp.]